MGSKLICRSLLTLLVLLGLTSNTLLADSPYPIRRGTKWVFKASDGTEKPMLIEGLTQLRLEGKIIPAALLRKSDGEDRLIVRSENQWMECGPLDTAKGSPNCNDPILFFRWPLKAGDQWESAGMIFEVVGQESIEVPLRRFDGAWKIRYTPQGLETSMGEIWVAEGVGRIRVLEKGADYQLSAFDAGSGPELATATPDLFAAVLDSAPKIVQRPGRVPSGLERLRLRLGREGLLLLGLPLLVLAAFFILGLSLLRALQSQVRELRLTSQRGPKDRLDLISAMAVAGDVSGARSRLEEMVSDQPDYADVRHQLALLLRAEGKLDESRTHWEKAVEINPRYAEARLALGGLLLELDEPLPARDQFTAVLEQHPNYPDAYLGIARAFLSLGDGAQARKALTAALEINPRLIEAQELLKEAGA